MISREILSMISRSWSPREILFMISRSWSHVRSSCKASNRHSESLKVLCSWRAWIGVTSSSRASSSILRSDCSKKHMEQTILYVQKCGMVLQRTPNCCNNGFNPYQTSALIQISSVASGDPGTCTCEKHGFCLQGSLSRTRLQDKVQIVERSNRWNVQHAEISNVQRIEMSK